MKTKIEIVPAEQKDLYLILNIQKECYQEEAEFYNDYNIPPLKQDMESISLDLQKNILLKAVLDGQIVASVRGYQDAEGNCHIGRLMVVKAFQNKGFGQLMMHAIESKFDQCNRFELFTGYKSERNLHLYHKLGYHEFKQERVTDNVSLVYLEKPNEKRNGTATELTITSVSS